MTDQNTDKTRKQVVDHEKRKLKLDELIENNSWDDLVGIITTKDEDGNSNFINEFKEGNL